MPGTPAPQTLELARFKTLDGSPTIDLPVHFNPVSLQYTIQNQLKEEGQGAKKKQHVSQTTAKLTMDLVFDTTDTGNDVRTVTDQMAKLLQPVGKSQAPQRVEFSWGSYSFQGLVEQYKETIDFFSAGGVPLRASINLTLASQEVTFESKHNPSASVDRELTPDTVTVPTPGGSGSPSPSSVANQLGSPRAARAIAAANGSASLRFGASAGVSIGGSLSASVGASAGIGGSVGGSMGASAGFGASAGASAGLSISGGVTLSPAAAFSVGASAGAGFGFGASAGAGIGIGASGGIGFGASAGASAGIGFGASAGASAGIGFSASATATSSSAFANLRATSSGFDISIPDPKPLIATTSSSVSLGASGQFGPGGRALTSPSGASLSANVGANADLSARLKFAT